MRTRILSLALVLGVFVVRGAAQTTPTARFSADRAAVLIGEPIELTLIVEIPETASVTLPTFPMQWGAFLVREAGALTETTNDGIRTLRQTLRVLLWQIGAFETPHTRVTYQLPGAAAPQELQVEPVTITVNSVLQPDDLALRPFRPPVALPCFPWWLATFGLIGVVAGTFWTLRFLRRWRSSSERRLSESGHHPAARAAVQRIESLNVLDGTVYALAADCVRHYIVERFGVMATDLTTSELLSSMEVVNAQRRHELRQLMERADLVKFAQAQSRPKAAQHYLAAARRWVLAVEMDLQAQDV